MSAFDELVTQHRLVVCIGPGGGGKTTVAASLALRAAALGRRAFVLTIDPARRLADVLGLDTPSDLAHAVALPGDHPGTLSAAMLDTRVAWDELLTRVVADAANRSRIHDNRIYDAFSRTMARSHAYIAIERLYVELESDDYDLVVLDMPPMQSALDILDAPGRLVRFLDDGIVRWFLKWPARASGTASKLRPGTAALEVLAAVADRDLVMEMVDFLRLFATMREGFALRAASVKEELVSASTAFAIVTSLDSTAIDDAHHLREALLERGAPLRAVVFNRAFTPDPGDAASQLHPDATTAAEILEALYPEDAPPGARDLVTMLQTLRTDLVRSNARGAERMARFVASTGTECSHVSVPTRGAEPTSPSALLWLARHARTVDA